jgi:hypothetical protein
VAEQEVGRRFGGIPCEQAKNSEILRIRPVSARNLFENVSIYNDVRD